MNTVSTFNFNTAELRVVTIDGNPWFALPDIRAALDLVQGGSYLYGLGEDEKQVIRKSSNRFTGLFHSRSGIITLLSESGLYKLVMRSDKPEARAFQDWVTKTVLPAIRKDGVPGQ